MRVVSIRGSFLARYSTTGLTGDRVTASEARRRIEIT